MKIQTVKQPPPAKKKPAALVAFLAEALRVPKAAVSLKDDEAA